MPGTRIYAPQRLSAAGGIGWRPLLRTARLRERPGAKRVPDAVRHAPRCGGQRKHHASGFLAVPQTQDRERSGRGCTAHDSEPRGELKISRDAPPAPAAMGARQCLCAHAELDRPATAAALAHSCPPVRAGGRARQVAGASVLLQRARPRRLQQRSISVDAHRQLLARLFPGPSSRSHQMGRPDERAVIDPTTRISARICADYCGNERSRLPSTETLRASWRLAHGPGPARHRSPGSRPR